MKYFILLILSILIVRCSDDDVTVEPAIEFYGKYDITSFTSDINVDLNDDGILSTELMNEIDSFDSSRSGLEIRQANNILDDQFDVFVSFSFPRTYITFDSPGKPQGDSSFLGFGFSSSAYFIDDSFDLGTSNYMEPIYIDNVENNKEVFIVSDLKILDENRMELLLSKEQYDYATASWIRLNITVSYLKQFD